jgi:hypothetical protein
MRLLARCACAALCAAMSGCYIETMPENACRAAGDCLGAEFCIFPDADACGQGGATGLCVRRPQVCPEYFAPVCGCDGITYGNRCFAQGAGTDIAYEGACAEPCAAQDAHGVGACRVCLGYAWDGARCVMLSGCRCVGADCGALSPTRAACESAAPASCVPNEPDAGKPQARSRSSISKTRVAFAGITGGNPRAPYASSGGIVSLRLPPIFMPATPRSQPWMTRPAPSGNLNGVPRSRELSNLRPSSSVPT